MQLLEIDRAVEEDESSHKDGDSDTKSTRTSVPATRPPTGAESSGAPDGPSATRAEAWLAMAGCFYLNMVVLWSYQSLLASLALYEERWPRAHVSFTGLVVFGVAMCAGQGLQLATRGAWCRRYGVRIIPGYAILTGVCFVLLLAPSEGTILGSFATVGLVCCLTEAPLYSLASRWPDSALTTSLNAGNGAAGVLNISALTAIRLALSGRRAGAPSTLDRANRVFLLSSLALTAAAIPAYCALVRVRPLGRALRGAQSQAAEGKDAGGEVVSYGRVWAQVRAPFLCQLLSFATTLLLWPGLACAAEPTGWFAAHAMWFCSPAIIAAFNVADFVGKAIGNQPRVVRVLSLRACVLLTVCRAGFAMPIALALPGSGTSVWSTGVLAAVVGVGLSNGLLATRTMCLGPQCVQVHERAVAADFMVLSLYLGITVGSLSGYAVGRSVLFSVASEI